MPSIKQSKIVCMFFVAIVILSLFPFFVETGKRPDYNINKKLIDEYYNRDNLKNSKHWDLTGYPIHIDGNTGWVIASSKEWCSGSGTFTDPYIIENVTIDGQNSDSCIKIKNSDKHFRIENCTIYNSGIENWDAGIIVENVSNGFLKNNNCSFNNRKGIIIKNSHNNTVSKNIVSNNNENGIALYEYSNNNIISENIANNNSKYGILLIDSNNNIISQNTVNYSIDESGVCLENSKNNIISGNNVNNNQWFGISLFYSENNTILGNTVKNNYYGIHLYFSVNNSILKNTANNNSFGIALYDNDESSVLKNTVHNNENFGIRLQDSDNNKIIGNNVKKNKDDGIILTNCDTNVISENAIEDNQIGLNISDTNSQDNHIYKNYFTGNKKQNAQDDGNNNNWNNTIIGNYWNDHMTVDVDNNGIDDSPYVISGSSIDYFPIYGNPFHNGKKIHINGNEISGNKSWIWTSTRAWCSGSGTLEDPYIIKDLVVDGENEDICIIIANSSNNYFVIKNCEVYNSGAMWPHAGIRLEYTNNGTLINNNCSSISGNGILLYESNYNLISGNTATLTELVGIYLVSSHNNIISENNASYNFNWNGITLWDSNNNLLLKNIVTKNVMGVYVRNSKYNNISRNSIYKNLDNGLWLYNSTNNIILENNVNDNNYNGIVIDTNSNYNIVSENIVNWNSQAGIGLWNTKYTNISENIVNKNAWGIYVKICHFNNISRNTVNNNEHGIMFEMCNNNTMRGNTANNNNYDGIYLSNSSFNIILENTVSNNKAYGISLYSNTEANLVYVNSFIENNINSRDYGKDNKWDNGTIGNYWSDYDGKDSDDDGIGDSIYKISGPSNSFDYNPIWWDPPSITIISPNPYDLFGINPPNFTISIDEGIINTTWYSLNNGNNTTFIGFTALIDQGIWNKTENGTISIKVYANDSKGYIGFAELMIRKDTIAPNITIHNPISNEVFGKIAPKFNISIIEGNLNTTWYTIDGGAKNIIFTLNGSIEQTLWDNLGNGIVMIRFYANDTMGNIRLIEVIIKKDTISPIITVNNPISNEVFGKNAPNFNISIIESNLDTTWYRLNDSTKITKILIITNSTGSIQQSLWGKFKDGFVTIRFYANDTVGNIGFKEITIRKDAIDEISLIINTIIITGGILTVSSGGLYVVKKKKVIHKLIRRVKTKKIGTMPISKNIVTPEELEALLSPQELEELRRTESEMEVHKKEYLCIVHKGPIEGANIYLCPNCHTLYCIKCANALKKNGEKCWSCNTEILP